jgi:CheY-like chemotaxis protein
VSLQAGRAAQPALSFATGYDGPRRSVLVVDDVVASRRMLADLLGPLGFQVSEAVDGQHALHQMERTCPDLVLMDMAMPVMDGMEATRRIRRNPAWRRLPVIALSAHASNSDRLLCIDAGANAYLSKPFDRDALLVEIGSLLSLQWQRRSAATLGGTAA